MKYYIICGERSGDLHASNLIKELKELDSEAIFRGMGGDKCEAEGMSLVTHYQEISFMGFLEVALGFKKVLKYLNLIKNDLFSFSPDILILVDFGGFNMKIASFAKTQQIPTHYYIPPKVWAWNQKRVHKIKDLTDKVYCILPFEVPFFKKYGVNAVYVGNPLLDEIKEFKPHPFFHQKNELNYMPIIALLPGSRKQEIKSMLKTMLKVVGNFPNAQFIVAGVSNVDKSYYDLAKVKNIKVIYDQTYDLLHHATAAVVASGTATLETALFRVPQVVVYKTSPISYSLARLFIKVKYISLVNLIAEQEVVTELIQSKFTSEKVSKELNSILGDIQSKAKVLAGYTIIQEKLGEEPASRNTALEVFKELKVE